MHQLWLVVFIISLLMLIVLFFRRTHLFRLFGYVVLNIVLAAFLLYFVNLIGSFYDFRIPINVPTVSSVFLLGIPGLFMLIALKLVLL